MIKTIIDRIVDRQELNNKLLLVSLMVLLFILPFFPEWIYSNLFEISISIILIFASFSIGRFFKSIIPITFIILSVEIISFFFKFNNLELVARSLNILFFLFLTAALIYSIAKRKKVDILTILESINGYLLMGMAFSIIVSLIQLINPESFNIDMMRTGRVFKIDAIYYTFVTMSTLGYGDLLPQANYAKSTSMLISLSGQIYLAVIIAMLVGKLSNQRSSE